MASEFVPAAADPGAPKLPQEDSESTLLADPAMIRSEMNASNLFEAIPTALPEELVEVIAEGRGEIRIVRLVSRGHASPDGFWYDQEEHEWVVLLSGAAVMSFEEAGTGQVRAVSLKAGDWLSIPPHSKHRVESTTAGETTVWLAVHWG